jgi:hypothetical protein
MGRRALVKSAGLETAALCHPDRPHAGKGLCGPCLKRDEGELDRDVKLKRVRYAEIAELHKAVEYVENQGRTARAILQERLPEYADLHWKAAQAAAEKGDARPAEWALQSVKAGKASVVEPPPKVPAEAGVKVFVGVNIGGIPQSATEVAIDTSATPVPDV